MSEVIFSLCSRCGQAYRSDGRRPPHLCPACEFILRRLAELIRGVAAPKNGVLKTPCPRREERP